MATRALPAVRRLLIVTGAVVAFLAVGIAVAQYEPPSTNANASGETAVMLRAILTDGQSVELHASKVVLRFPSGGELQVNQHGILPHLPSQSNASGRTPAEASPSGSTIVESNRRQPVTAPIYYSETFLVLADEKAVALVDFQCPATAKPEVSTTSEPVSYRFRYRAKGEKDVAGEGMLYERYVKREGEEVLDDQGRLRLVAGHFDLEWSKGGADKGWLYFKPEDVSVHFVTARDFDEFDLERFRR